MSKIKQVLISSGGEMSGDRVHVLFRGKLKGE